MKPMLPLRRYGYTILWTFLALLVLALIAAVFQVQVAPSRRPVINPESYTPAQARLEQQRKEAGENPLLTQPPDVVVKGTEIVLSSPDGEMKMRLTSSEAFSQAGVVSLPRADIEFALKDRRKLYILAEALRYTLKEETAEVTGRLSGEITPLAMRFTAEGVRWDRSSRILTLVGAVVVDPAFRVEGKDIRVDLRSETLEVLGGVRVNL